MPRELDVLLPEILRRAPNCPDPLAFRVIREVARKACEMGLFWRETDEIIFTDGEPEGLCSVEDAEIVKIEAAEMNGQSIEAKAVAWLDAEYPFWDRDKDVSNPPRFVTQTKPNTLSLYPRSVGTLQVRLVLKPSRTATTLPDFLVDQHYEILGKGAAAEVMMTPDAKVQNYELGADLRNVFQRWLDGLNVKAAKGQQGARLRTKGQYL
jgi:hypothetical protein